MNATRLKICSSFWAMNQACADSALKHRCVQNLALLFDQCLIMLLITFWDRLGMVYESTVLTLAYRR